MYANIVLSGGGAKGAVLGGCLKAAEDKGIKPKGFGGTSAGSIVAALASVGYSGADLKSILTKTNLVDLLDDGGKELDNLKSAATLLARRLKNRSYLSVFSIRAIARLFENNYGLYDGAKLKAFLVDLFRRKLGEISVSADQLTFNDLEIQGCKPLRIVATDLNLKRAVIFGSGRKGADRSVIDTVVASASFPFAFQPSVIDGMLLIDGGLSSNLPSFLFEEEYRHSRTPTLAFDLVPPPRTTPISTQSIEVGAFVASLLGCALEASDVLLREATPGVTYFPIPTPDGIGTLDFGLSATQREACFDKGYAEAAAQLERFEPIERTRRFGSELQKRIITQFGPPMLYEPVLRALIQQVDLTSSGELGGMRAHIMLLTGRASDRAASTRIVTYAVGMDNDADRDLELDEDGGCSGKAWESGKVAVACLETAAANPIPWKMSIEQHNKVPRRVKSMISVPIPGNLHAPSAPIRPAGTLSVDCETRLADTGWCVDGHGQAGVNPDSPPEVVADVLTVMSAWASVVGAMLP